ncbi:hypothetical protein THRCLA_09385 [Thraustotheca clavata]|uniref:Phosphatidic acid phosphatase type 2/haloperoxidase domain-containing protein n=1 Tax=Thraustotheca clavata TaxID=74557 RepID=A0A1V9YXC8_9STRA|nr:hypothetical protein THRCLA_09385 [Thraustotheca clavata]
MTSDTLVMGSTPNESLWLQVHWVSPLMTLIFWIVSVSWGLSTTPSYRYLNTYNPTISEATSHPYQQDTISYPALCGACAAFWIVVVAAVEFSLKRHDVTNRLFYIRLANLSLGCLEAVLLSIAATNLIKFNVGYLRPNFAAMCQPVLKADNTYECTSPPSKFQAAMISFPSGHASTGATTGLYTTIYLLWTLYCRARPANISPKAMIWCRQTLFIPSLLPVFLAFTVAVTRVTDWKHHTIDITMGTLIGFFFACVTAFRVLSIVIASDNSL